MVTKLETRADSGEDDTAPSRVSVLTSLDDARADWDELYADASVSPYQSHAFLSRWCETIGGADGREPMIVVATSVSRRTRALLPLTINNRGGLRIAAFAGGRESNMNLPLLRAGLTLDSAEMRDLLLRAAREAPTPPDLYYLRNQPRQFDGIDNPLAFPTALPSPSFAYGARLPATGAELDERSSKDARKKLRKKEARLAQLGALNYEHGVTGERAWEIVKALIAQKSARLATKGVGSAFSATPTAKFLEHLCLDGSLEAHALSVSGRIVATYAGMTHRGRFSAMLNSFEAGERVARCSPGDLLLQATLADLCGRGLTRFDLGAGEARYKNAVCDETIELFDAAIAASALGALAAPAVRALLRGKRRIKQTPWMASALSGARLWLARRGK